jgi:Ricin-type beta-trefoil lectin domain
MMAVAAVAAVMVPALAGSASASSADYVCDGASTSAILGCIKTAGVGAQVALDGTYTSSLTTFQETHGTTWDGRDVYEYQQAGTSDCLEWEISNGYEVVMEPCDPGLASQLWWYDPSDTLVNDGATGHAGQQECLDAPNNGSAVANLVEVDACSFDYETQLWWFRATP